MYTKTPSDSIIIFALYHQAYFEICSKRIVYIFQDIYHLCWSFFMIDVISFLQVSFHSVWRTSSCSYFRTSLHSGNSHIFFFIWKCLPPPLITEEYFHQLWNSGLTVLFPQHFKNVPFPAPRRDFWWEICSRSNHDCPRSNVYQFSVDLLQYFFVVFSFYDFSKALAFWFYWVWRWISWRLSLCRYAEALASVNFHLLLNWGSFQLLFLLIFFCTACFPSETLTIQMWGFWVLFYRPLNLFIFFQWKSLLLFFFQSFCCCCSNWILSIDLSSRSLFSLLISFAVGPIQ